jgi:hypothetical protein
MHLSKVNETLSHRICSGSEYGWKCYPDSRYLDYESDFAYVSVIYSTIDQTVYQAEVSVKREAWDEDKKPYRWLNPEYQNAFYKESKKRNVDPNQAWDDVKWIDLEVESDWLEKAKAIFNGLAFDGRVQVELDLKDDEILKFALEAHKRDITLNKLVEIVLQEAIDKHKVNETLG